MIIKEIDIKNRKLKFKFDNNLFKINFYSLLNNRFKYVLKDYIWEYEVGDYIENSNIYCEIIDRFYKNNKRGHKEKWYKYKCNMCGFIGERYSSNIKDKKCECCCNQKIICGVNSVYDKAEWMIPYIGEDLSKTVGIGSILQIKPKCPHCGKVKSEFMTINKLYQKRSIGCDCSDGISYPEKVMISILNQLKISFIREYKPLWSKNKRYDFFFEYNNKSYIVEVHGEQHYVDSMFGSKENQAKNDLNKRMLALNNGIDEYIVLDCRNSNINFIKNNIYNSYLNQVFNLDKIDWLLACEFATNNLYKEICLYKSAHKDCYTKELMDVFQLSKTTIIKALKQGELLGWCQYNPKEDLRKRTSARLIRCIDDNEIGYSGELANRLTKKYNMNFYATNILKVCKGTRKTHNNLKFEFL